MNKEELQSILQESIDRYAQIHIKRTIDSLLADAQGHVTINGFKWVFVPVCSLDALKFSTYSAMQAVYIENNIPVPEFITYEINEELTPPVIEPDSDEEEEDYDDDEEEQ